MHGPLNVKFVFKRVQILIINPEMKGLLGILCFHGIILIRVDFKEDIFEC
jgi:hypothetical protein